MDSFEEIFQREWVRQGGAQSPLLVFHATIDSTSSDLRRRLEQGAPMETVVAADFQSSGRGRRGNTWHSHSGGNLYVSVALRVDSPLEDNLPLVPLAAGIAAIDGLRDCATCPATLKWPNDVLVGDRKLAGILCELPRPDLWPGLVIVGMGINIAEVDFPLEIRNKAISLQGVAEENRGPLPHPAKLAASWISRLHQWTLKKSFSNRNRIVTEWKKRAEPFGRRVRVGDVEGKTVDLTREGRLVIECKDGRREVVAGGVVENMGD